MGLVIVIVFLGVFAMVAALMLTLGKNSSGQTKKVLAALDSAIAPEGRKPVEKTVNFRKSELLSAVPWLNKSLLKVDLAENLHRLLNQADLKWTAGKLLLLCLTALAGTFYLINLRTKSFTFSLLCGIAVGLAPLGFVIFKRAQRFGKFEKALPDALDMMVSALRVGHSFSAALSLVTHECPDPLASEFRTCFDEQNFGLELRAAMENLITRVPLQDLRIAVTAILIQKESGGNLAEVLEKTAYVIRQRFRLKRQIQVHTAQGRLTGLILTLLPVILGIGLYIVNPAAMSLLWTRPIGIKLLYAAGAMLVIGTALIQKIVRMDV
jgi:tight adherence protein B